MHPVLTQHEFPPHPWDRPNNETKTQLNAFPDSSSENSATDKHCRLEVLDTVLYYDGGLDANLRTVSVTYLPSKLEA
jgi:hypothetical protein